MANTENVNGQDDVQDKKQRKHDSGAADLERVTDWTEEKEISGDISNVNKLIFDQFAGFKDSFDTFSGCQSLSRQAQQGKRRKASQRK